jgi:hypothetical protein
LHTVICLFFLNSKTWQVFLYLLCVYCFWLFVVDLNFPVHAAFQGATPFSTTLEKSETLCYVRGGCNDILHFVSLSSKSCYCYLVATWMFAPQKELPWCFSS